MSEQVKHDGKLDTYTWGENPHAECAIDTHGLVFEITYLGGRTVWHGYLEAAQALSLLDYLIQEKPTLERLAKEQGQS